MKDKRRDYMDVLKFLGIFSIYIGHCGNAAGMLYPFVFSFHVPLFFFVSGCMENCGKSRSFVHYVLHKVKSILIPWFLFAVFSRVIVAINDGASLKEGLLQIAQGCIRNQFSPAGGLWFLTCLFVISVIFYIVKMVGCGKKPIILLICLLVFVVSQTLLPGKPQQNPMLLWNIDSAMYYIIFYGLGYCIFPPIDKALNQKKRFDVIIICIVGLVSFVYTGFLFFGINVVNSLYLIPIFGMFTQIIQPLIVIAFFMLLSYFLQIIKPLQKLGQDSLYFCCNEYFVHTIVYLFARLFNIQITLSSPIATVLYIIFLIYIAAKVLIPVEKQILQRLFETGGRLLAICRT